MTAHVIDQHRWMIGHCFVRTRFWALGFLAVIALLAGGPLYAAEERDPAWLGAHQLMAAQLPSGQFAFEHDFLLGRGRPDTLSGFGRMAYITREAGTAYVLSLYLLHNPNIGVARALAAVLRNLGQLSVPIDKTEGRTALEAAGILALPVGRYKLYETMKWLDLLYRPTGEGRLVSFDHSYDTAWGGATALTLLTELQFYRASHDPRFKTFRQAWLRGLLVLYDGVGGFRTLPGSTDENALSNGEIWLALAYYARLFPDDRATAAILARVDDYMMRTYAAQPSADFYSWGMKAAAQRLTVNSDVRLRQFIAQQTRAYLNGVGPPASSTENTCAMVEGLAEAFHVLTETGNPDGKLIQGLRQRIDREMSKNRSLQIQPDQTRIELGNGAYLFSPSVPNYAGAFLSGAHEPYVRIDYTAHCVSALLALGGEKR